MQIFAKGGSFSTYSRRLKSQSQLTNSIHARVLMVRLVKKAKAFKERKTNETKSNKGGMDSWNSKLY
jgi:hypothetical protein